VRRLVLLECASQCVLSVALLNEATFSHGGHPNCPLHDPSPAACARAYFYSAHLSLAAKWTISQLPVRFLVLPEVARNVLVALLTLAYAARWQEGGLTLGLAAAVLARGAATAALVPLAAALCHNRVVSTRHLPAGLDTAPAALSRAVSASAWRARAAAAALLPEAIVEPAALTGTAVGVLTSIAINGGLGRGFVDVARRVNVVVFAAAAVSAASKLHAGTASGLELLERRLRRRGARDAAAAALDARLAAAVSEHDVLRVASEACTALFPSARAQALASLAAEGGGAAAPHAIAFLEVTALDEGERRALQAALTLPEHTTTSAAFVCAPGGGDVADSHDWREGTAAFADWAAATSSGCAAAQIVTARLSGGPTAAGFLVLAFGSAEGGFASDDVAAHAALRSFCDAVGAALLRRRALDAAQLAAAAVEASQALARDVFPPHLLAALNSRQVAAAADRAADASTDGGAGVAAAAEVDLLMDHHDDVSIVFADICSWTQIASALTPEAAMRLLDSMWQRFDTLATSHGCYKVETIGDSYLAVVGMLPARRDHGRAALRFALDLHAAAAGVEASPGCPCTIRVGIHAGPVTSGVVGHLRQRWCIFGDAGAAAAARATRVNVWRAHARDAVADMHFLARAQSTPQAAWSPAAARDACSCPLTRCAHRACRRTCCSRGAWTSKGRAPWTPFQSRPARPRLRPCARRWTRCWWRRTRATQTAAATTTAAARRRMAARRRRCWMAAGRRRALKARPAAGRRRGRP
jgi:class 3 adenylate cyclase